MNHIKALVMKFIMIAVILTLVLTWIFGANFSDTLVISLVLTIVAYALGDLAIFRQGNRYEHGKRNTTATISDFVLSFLVIWLMGEWIVEDTVNMAAAALVSAIVLALGEWFFHKYLDKRVFPEKFGTAQGINRHDKPIMR